MPSTSSMLHTRLFRLCGLAAARCPSMSPLCSHVPSRAVPHSITVVPDNKALLPSRSFSTTMVSAGKGRSMERYTLKFLNGGMREPE